MNTYLTWANLESDQPTILKFYTISFLKDNIVRKLNAHFRDFDKSFDSLVKLKTWFLEYATKLQTTESPIVYQIATSYALLSKRYYMTPDLNQTSSTQHFREMSIRHIEALFSSSDSMHTYVGLVLCEAFVEEFETSSKSSPMNLPLEFHQRCFSLFEEEELRMIFELVQQLLKKLTQNRLDFSLIIFKNALELLNRILSWPFGKSISASNIDRLTTIKLPTSWASILNANSIEMILEIALNVLHQDNIAHIAFQSLEQLSLIIHQGDIGTEEYLQGWTYPLALAIARLHETPGLKPERLLQISQMTYNFLLSNRLFMSNIDKENSHILINLIHKNTKHTLDFMLQGDPENSDIDIDRTHMGQALDNWINVWVHLSTESIKNRIKYLQPLAYEVVEAYIKFRMEQSNQPLECEDDELEDEYMNEQLTNIGLLARLAPKSSSELVIAILNDRITAIKCMLDGSLTSDVIEEFDKLYWILMIAGHFLTNDSRGETPSIPHCFIALSHYCESNGIENYIITLTNMVFTIADLESQIMYWKKANNYMWSPLVARTLMWFFSRWSLTYLMLQEMDIMNKGKTLYDAFSETSSNAHNLLNFLFEKIRVNFLIWSGENDVMLETCALASSLSKLNVTTDLFNTLTSWKSLIDTYIRGDFAWDSLSPRVLRKMIQSFISFTYGSDTNERIEFVVSICSPIIQKLEYMIQPSYIAPSSQPIECILESLRGIIQSTNIVNYRTIYNISSPYLSPLVHIMKTYKQHTNITLSIVKVFSDFATCNLSLFEDKVCLPSYNVIADFFRDYTSLSIGKDKLDQIRVGENEVADILSKEIYALLKMLSSIAFNANQYIIEVVYIGIHNVLPLITKEMLEYPKILRIFFDVISTAMDRQITFIQQLPDDLFAQLMYALDFGIHSLDASVQVSSLEAIKAIAAYRYELLCAGQDLGGQKPSQCEPFLKKLFSLILVPAFKIELITYVSDSILYLILSNNTLYQSIVHEIANLHPHHQEHIRYLFNALQDGVENSNDKANLERFLANMKQFIVSIQGLVNTK